MEQKGIRGLLIKDEGITTSIHVFNQDAVKFRQEFTRTGFVPDNVVAAINPEGLTEISTIVPSWRNSITMSLLEKGIPEKEIGSYLDMHIASMGKRLDDLMDSELRNLKNASAFSFSGGCV